jgi:hypothetical protein
MFNPLVLSVIACFCVCAAADAALVTLKSGERLNGFIVDERDDRLVMRINGVDVDVMNADITTVEFSDPRVQQEMLQQAVVATQANAARAAPIVPTAAMEQSIRERSDPRRLMDEKMDKQTRETYEQQLKEREKFGKEMADFFDTMGYDTKELRQSLQQPDFWDKKR